MSEKVVLVSDIGIDGAFAVSLALFDPNLEVLGLAATPGNVSAEQATHNIHVVIEQLDPPRWPRLGAAPSIEYDVDGTKLHGPHGLGNTDFPCVPLHHLPHSEKLVADLVRTYPREVTVVCLGPASVLSRTLDLCPEFPSLARRIILVGGSLHEPGNAGPVSEFHFYCDPDAARRVIRCDGRITLVPLDVLRQVLFSPSDLLDLPTESKAGRFLRQIVPFGIAATSNLYGIEGFHLKDVVGIVAVTQPEALRTRSMRVDVETRGELTRGMTVFDQRSWQTGSPNVEVVLEVNSALVHKYITRILRPSAA